MHPAACTAVAYRPAEPADGATGPPHPGPGRPLPPQHCARPSQRQALQAGGQGPQAAGGVAPVLRPAQGY